jgi:hypothetical protein
LRPAADASGRVPAASWATYALLHVRRAPEFPAERVARYGASYGRSLFTQYGLFRDDLRIGEDTEFNTRIAASTGLAWAPDVVTLHHYPKSVRAAWAQAVERGRHTYAWFAANVRHPVVASVKRSVGNWVVARKLAQLTSGETQAALRRAAPLIALFAIAYGYGAIAAAFRNGGVAPISDQKVK